MNNILPFEWNVTQYNTAWKQELFYSRYVPNAEYKWCDTDIPENAIYIDDTISYKFNEYGFRSDSFTNRSDYNILVTGCSLTVGIGVPFESVWFNKLADKIKEHKQSVTVWSLAQSAASPDYVVRSLYKTIGVLKPDLVVVLWPSETRFEFPNDNQQTLRDYMLPSDNNGCKLYPKHLISDEYFKHQLQKNILFTEMLCKCNNVDFIHGPCEGTPVNVGPRTGARDKHHPDKIWHNEWATAVYEYWITHCKDK